MGGASFPSLVLPRETGTLAPRAEPLYRDPGTRVTGRSPGKLRKKQGMKMRNEILENKKEIDAKRKCSQMLDLHLQQLP